MNIAIIFASGIGQRLNSGVESIPKQFLEINEKPILIYTLENFQNHKSIDKIYVATLNEYIDYVNELVKKYSLTKVSSVVEGGSCAMESIYNALIEAKKENPSDSIVLIHDGVRPIITQEVISNNIKSVIEKGNSITAVPCNETLIVSKDGSKVDSVPIRKESFKAQAPQSFRLDEIIKAHEAIIPYGYENVVDNATLFMKLNKKVYLTKGNFGNIKVTTKEDVYLLKGILEYINSKNEENEKK